MCACVSARVCLNEKQEVVKVSDSGNAAVGKEQKVKARVEFHRLWWRI